MAIFNSYVKLPEGSYGNIAIQNRNVFQEQHAILSPIRHGLWSSDLAGQSPHELSELQDDEFPPWTDPLLVLGGPNKSWLGEFTLLHLGYEWARAIIHLQLGF